MSGASRDLVDSSEQGREAPDYFSYYKIETARVLSENEDILIVPNGRECGKVNGKRKIDCVSCVDGPPFGDSLGAVVSDLKKERLKAVLLQSANVLSKEVSEMLDPVLRMHRMKCLVQRKNSSKDDSDEQLSPIKEDDDMKYLLQGDSKIVEDALKKYTDEISNTLVHMERSLEELLDTVTTKCRPMTLTEKRRLQRMIQKLPQENLGRVAEITQHKKIPGKKDQDKIFVDLELEDNATLWRLYYYAQAVENAKMLAK